MAELLDGERVAQRMKMELADRASRLAAAGRPVGLGTILVGDDGPSAKYVAMKHADCKAIGVVSFHEHIAKIDSDAEFEALVFGQFSIERSKSPLGFYGAADRIHYTGEFGQNTVSSGADNPAPVLLDESGNDFPIGLQSVDGSFLILAHQAAISLDIGT